MANDQSLDLKVRRATVADQETVVEFNAALAWESEGKRLDIGTLTTGVAAVFKSGDRGFYCVAEAGGRVVGQLMITYEWSDWRNGYFWWIQSVYVASEYRRRGVYRALEAYVKSEAEAQGDVCGFRLYVEKNNHVAQQVYANLGMVQSDYDLLEIDFVLGS